MDIDASHDDGLIADPGRGQKAGDSFMDERTLFRHVPLPVVLMGPGGTIVDYNPAATTFMGYTRDEVIGRKMEDFLSSATLDRLPDILRDEAANGGIIARIQVLTADGVEKTVDACTRLFSGDEGNHRLVVFCVPYIGDPTRKGCATAHIPSESPADHALRTPVTGAADIATGAKRDIPDGDMADLIDEPEMTLVCDATGRIIQADDRFLSRTGYTTVQLADGISLSTILAGDDAFNSALKNGANGITCPLTGEFRLITKEGALVAVFGTVGPSETAEGSPGLVCTLVDITEHKRFERNLVIMEKLNALGEMAGGVVHDFNNILTIILGNVDLLRNIELDADASDIVEKIERAAVDGSEIVRRLQNFSHSGVHPPLEHVDINGIVGDVIAMLNPALLKKTGRTGNGINITTELGDIQPVLACPGEIREVLGNILMNAVDAVTGEGDIRVSTHDDGDMVVLSVTDTGCGMTEDVLERVFEPFFTTKEHDGTGLGMSVSFGIINKLGGDIDVTSKPGDGTTVTIILPACTSDTGDRSASTPSGGGIRPVDGDMASRETPPEHGKRRHSGLDILVVDDEPNICDLLEEFLSVDGHDVTVATSGDAGLKALEQGGYDVVLTDLNMGKISGRDIARAVRKMWPDTTVILLTGSDPENTMRTEQGRSIDLIIHKPIKFSELTQAIIRARALHGGEG